MFDFHTHINPLDQTILKTLQSQKLFILPSCKNPNEWSEIKKLANKSDYITPTFGIHPWQSDKISAKQCYNIFKECDIIGEIGMDSVWCDVDIKTQEKAFIEQLDIAKTLNKTVILHTKGQEEKILKIISNYPMTFVIHWYSCNEFLSEYIKNDYYFTVGPSVNIDPTVLQVAKQVPLNRLLVETDGVDAVQWATGEKISFDQTIFVLQNTIKAIAKVKNIDYLVAYEQIVENSKRLLEL